MKEKRQCKKSMAQDFLGCEVAAEVGRLDKVYCIVTNYIQWDFLRSLDDKVQWEDCCLRLTPNGPERESLKEIAEKIFLNALKLVNSRLIFDMLHLYY